jgi:hypothetical protein
MHRVIAVLIVLVTLPLPVLGGSLSGTVTRTDSGAAVAGAQVLIRGTGQVTVSGADGSYSIASVPSGNYGITCSAAGLRGESTGAVAIGAVTTRDFGLQLPGADTTRIYGAISCAGQPCHGAIVIARQGGHTRVALSDAGGSFSIEAVSPGSYEVWAIAFEHLPQSVPDVVIDPPPDGGSMTPREVNLDLTAGGRYTVTGVVGLSDNPLERDGSTVRCNGQIPGVSATTTSGGSYQLTGLPAGLLSFTAARSGYNSVTHIDVLVSSDRSLDFILTEEGGQVDPTYSLSGVVTLDVEVDPDGGIPPNPAGSRVSVWSAGSDFHRTTSTDQNGRYSFGGLEPGAYQAGADREGFLPEVADSFQLSADRSLDFTLRADPDYDWGPGGDDDPPSCGCAGGSASAGLLFGLLALLLGDRLRRGGWRR